MKLFNCQKHSIYINAMICLGIITYGFLFINIESKEVQNNLKKDHIRHSAYQRRNINKMEKLKLGLDSQYKSMEDDKEKLHRLRIQHIRDICETPSSLYYTWTNDTVYYYTEKYNFAYCKVPKCGSTFWTQVFNVLKHGVKRADYIWHKYRRLVHGTMYEFLTDFNKVESRKTPTILVSRNPYSRLYSAYIDRIYLPNLFEYSFKIARSKTPQDSSKCPIDNSLEDFLKFIVAEALKGNTLDRHWAPIVSLCRPCDIHPVILLKQESFHSDVKYILEKFNVEVDKRDVLMEALRNNRVQTTIPGIVGSLLGRTPKGKRAYKCLGASGIALRLWRSFQIQGYLKANIPFPVIENEHLYRNGSFLSELIVTAIETNPLSEEESKQQRRQFFEDAYRNVTPKTIKAIQYIYNSDFELYGYDIDPLAS